MLLTLDLEAAELLKQVTTERKKGEYVSWLLKQHASTTASKSGGVIERMEHRLTSAEKALDEIKRKLAQ